MSYAIRLGVMGRASFDMPSVETVFSQGMVRCARA